MELYEKVFGPYLGKGHKTGHDILINCLWHKDENASLAISTDPNKETFYCHGCGRKGSLIKAFMDLNNLSYSEALKALDMDKPYENRPVRQPIIPVKPPKEDIDYLDYIVKASSNVFDNAEFFCKKLYDYRGITMPTAVCCQIGYDHTKGWIFPVIRYSDNKVVGYEVREKFFQMFKFKDGKETKCYKAKGTPSCLCTVFE